MLSLRMFLFMVFIPAELILGQKNLFMDSGGMNFTVFLAKTNYTYAHALCPFGSRKMSYRMTQTFQRINFKWSGKGWINASAEYTQWMSYKGLKQLKDQKDKSAVLSVDGNQLSTCAVHCKGVRTFGLQIDKCVCLPNDDTYSNTNVQTVHVRTCNDSCRALCAGKNNQNIVTLYKRDTIQDHLNELGSCMTVRTNDTHVISYTPKRCDSLSDVQVVIGNEFRSVPNKRTWMETYKYVTGRSDSKFPSVEDLQTKTKKFRNGEFWLYNIREAIYIEKGPNNSNPFSFCVSGRTVNGKIKLRPENCNMVMPAVCVQELVSGTGPVLRYSTTILSDDKTTGTHRQTESAQNAPGVLVKIVVIFSIVLLAIVAASTYLIVRCIKQRNTDFVQGTVNATVKKDKIAEDNRNQSLNRISYEEVTFSSTGQENDYDHADFTIRSPLQQSDVSNYDTMGNIQVIGDSIYHHTVTFKASSHIPEVDDSIYHHADDY